MVDECHRGYLLDRELSDTELTFRGFEDYISKYRRVLDYFDAVKIGLTATPALHTTQIFGAPVFTYSYREAVIDGYLVDYEPPIQINTELSTSGIALEGRRRGQGLRHRATSRSSCSRRRTRSSWRSKTSTARSSPRPSTRSSATTWRRSWTRPSRRKTLIFCVNDSPCRPGGATCSRRPSPTQYGSVEDDAVIKITGAADKPLQLIRRYKNERMPNVAVTVDLLTTGMDVPEICNLVFLRRVNSRILFDQMLGRATRLCDLMGRGKETFRVFDAVQIFEAFGDMTAMKPVVVNPKISFTQLAQELATVDRRRRAANWRATSFSPSCSARNATWSNETSQGLRNAGRHGRQTPSSQKLRSHAASAKWRPGSSQNPDLGEILDRKGDGPARPCSCPTTKTSCTSVERGYGKAKKPEDYLREFSAFIKSHSNDMPALMTVLTRPRDLTRKQLRELALELDQAGFTETICNRLARADQPGHRRAHRRLHPPGRHRRCPGALCRARRPRPAAICWLIRRRQALDAAAARLAETHRSADQGQHAGRPRRA